LGSGDIDPRLLNLDTRWKWMVSFTPRPLCPSGKSHCTHWKGDFVASRAGLDAVSNRTNLITLPTGRWTPVVQPVA